ncbi:F-box protein CPR1 [Linum grandiflorum]
MSDHLPADLVTRILLRLPVDSLLCCRCVSKVWRTLIDSPMFSKLQIDHSAATGDNAILFIRELDDDGSYVIVEYVNGLRRGTGRIHPPAQISRRDSGSVFHLLGSCNGLLCFACDWEKVLIWNLATRKVYSMPFTLLMKSHKVGVFVNRDDGRKVFYNHGYGFGYVSDSDDYKVVQIVQLFKPELHSLNSHLVSNGVRSNSSVDVEFPYHLLGSRQTGVFVSGAIHWIVGRHEEDPDDEPEITIVGFDLGLNELREVPQPEYSQVDDFSSQLGELEKCLCIFAYYKDKFVDVWMMKEYGVKESWSILFSVRHPDLSYRQWMTPLRFSVTGQEVLAQLDGERLVWYDLKDPNKVVVAEEMSIDGLKGKMDAVVCYGSLVSPVGSKLPPPKEEVKKVDKQQQKPRPQRKKRDNFLASGFKLKL